MTPVLDDDRCSHNFRPDRCPNGNQQGFDGCPGPEWNTVPPSCPRCGAAPVHMGTSGDAWTWHCGRTGWFDNRRMPVIGSPSGICSELAEWWGPPEVAPC